MLPTLLALFFASGLSALIYQVLWLRLLGLVFGVTTYAASTVWASFMAGLALGSLAAGRVADRVRRPLIWFGVCELLIGATALSTPLGLDALQQIYMRLYPLLPASLAVMTLARFGIAFLLLIVPTALMGATLPLVIKSSVFRTTRLGERMALLYGMNTTGAIVGALAAGLYLIPGRGIQGTFLIAAGVNLLVGLCAMAAGTVVITPDDRPDSTATEPDLPARLDRGRARLVLWVFAFSGFTALALEVVWTRVLTLFLRPTVYGFALMLSAILAGIAIGSYIVTPFLDRRRSWMGILAVLELAIGVAAVLSFGFLTRMGPAAASVAPWLTNVMAEWLVYPTVGSLLAIFPTALLMGLAFPIGLRLWTAGGDGGARTVASRIGTFYSLNLGAGILGAAATGFLLLPWFGSRSSLIALGAISFAGGLILLAVSEWRRTTQALVGLCASVVFAGCVAAANDPFAEFLTERYRGQRLIWREEGVEATSAVVVSGSGEVSLTVNGNHQASTGPVMTFVHRAIGHLPMMLHPEARDVLVIGLGGGATAGAVSIHDGVEVDAVELAGSVARGARFLDSINYNVLTRPNVRLHIDDGRNFMLLTPRKYDVVTADVILPIFAGSGNLYSREYFEIARKVLKPGGMVVQWVAGTEAEYNLIARTFLSVFPNTTVWREGGVLIGTVEPLRLTRSDFEWKLQVPGRARGAHDLGADTFEKLARFYTTGPEELREFVGPGPILTDDHPMVEYFLSLPRDRDPDFSKLKKGDFHRLVVTD
ncbi:MAG TPA: fused MFS/spermidine synthase [Vicinamibacterales bacterium]|nr:fused MFS/spermidine synthase [Vicinamibacterales bacterium]